MHCCCCSVAKSCPDLCDPMDSSKPGSVVLHYLLELPQIYVHWVRMLSNHLILCHPLLLPSIFPSIRVFSNKSVLHTRWPKYWSFSFSIRPSNEYSGLISVWLVWSLCSPRDSQEYSSAQEFKSMNSLVLSLLYGPTLTFVHDYQQNHSSDYMDLCQQSEVSTLYYAV